MNYIKRTSTGIVLINNQSQTPINKGLTQYLNESCIKHLSTLKGRQKAAKVLLDKTANLPIYVNETCLLFPNQSLRRIDTVLINYFSIYDIIRIDGRTKIVFNDLQTLFLPQTETQLKNQFRACKKLLEHTIV
ncbi:MAG: competence protein ComK [Candidatus Izemoplasma sp.]|nr:competence protein ComK [Candidatus Izemoplasma sp.]